MRFAIVGVLVTLKMAFVYACVPIIDRGWADVGASVIAADDSEETSLI